MPVLAPPNSRPAPPTQHAMLIVWGHFAQTLGLRTLLEQVPIPEKTVQHSPGPSC